jgi:hypothetical protein
MNRDAAKSLLSVALDCSRRVDESVALVLESCSQETMKAYRRFAGRIMGNIFSEIAAPIYEAYPEFSPEWHKTGAGTAVERTQLSMAGDAHDGLLKLMDDVYGQLSALVFELGSQDANDLELARVRAGLHEVLFHVATTKAHLLGGYTRENVVRRDE